MTNKKVANEIAIGIILVVAITIGGVFYLKSKKEVAEVVSNNQLQQQKQQVTRPQQNNTQNGEVQKQTDTYPEVLQPKMPASSDEIGKSPENLVKDFYEWYIGNIDYQTYKTYVLRETANPINLNDLVQESPFISSTYEQNISKRRGMYDAILCTNDNEYNVVKEYGKASIKSNGAEVEILRGYTRNESTTKIRIVLKKEKSQWKIDDIICSFQSK